MSILEYLALIPVGVVGIYLAARVISAAFYQSKQQYERSIHGTQKRTR